MEDRERTERRIWRRALTLTGNPDGASWVLANAWKANANVMRLGESRALRLTAIKSRAWIGANGGYAGNRTPANAEALTDDARRFRGALRELEPSAREIWLLKNVVALDEMEIARGLGCTREVVDRYSQAAEHGLMATLGPDMHAGANAWAGFIGSISAADAIEQAQHMQRAIRTRKRIVSLIQIVVVLAVMGALVYFGLVMLNAQEQREHDAQYAQPGSSETE